MSKASIEARILKVQTNRDEIEEHIKSLRRKQQQLYQTEHKLQQQLDNCG